ncbi:MAG: ATP-binding protein [Gammaproteobacteria bacterium AqS3]|nr:ATP-binding protein [Gammaproteobacteria bacterium AqS3]
MVDFSKINSFDASGPRGSFEELICILAKREKPENAADFWPVEGSGGDGGVDAVWLLNNGGKVGYQAKYFLSLNSSRWRQIDQSVKKALSEYPELKEYIVAMPCNLTRANKQKWGESLEKWKTWAEEKDLEIEFKLWDELTLKNLLLTEKNSSLREYYWNEEALSDDWFQKRADSVTSALRNRYNPLDHVRVSIESVFDTMVRGENINRRITNYASQMRNTEIPDVNLKASEHISESDILQISQATDNTRDAKNKLVLQLTSLKQDFSQPWDINSVKASIDELGSSANSLSNEHSRVNYQSKTSNSLALHTLDQLLSFCHDLYDLFQEKFFLAEAAKCAVIYGPAGSGKSHIFGHIVEERLKNKLPTVLLLGQSFSNGGLWEQIGALLTLEKRTPEAILGMLNVAGERKNTRTLILIDAINEGVGSRYWRDKIPELLEELKKYPNLGVAFSCREEYLPYAMPQMPDDHAPQFMIRGFSTLEEMRLAAEQYLDKKGIASPNILWHSPEFVNPLFLKSVSEFMKAKGETELPLGIHGLTQLMAVYIDALCYQSLTPDSDPNQIKRAIKKLVKKVSIKMAEVRHDFITLDNANEIANDCFKGIQPFPGKSWLQTLIDLSLFRTDPPPLSEDSDPLDPPTDLIRFGFQRFQDYLMAQSLASNIDRDKLDLAFKENGILNFIFRDGKLKNSIDHRYAGLVGALSIIYPEEFKTEFVTTIPNWKKIWDTKFILQNAFSESCKWRCKKAFSDETSKVFNQLNERWINRIHILLQISMMTDHPWNALFLHSKLERLNLPDRDSYWTNNINLSLRNEGSNVERIISWASSSLIKKADIEHLRLASLVLTWLLSSSHRTLRDRATKALTYIFLENSEILIFLSEKIADCDDPYVIERFYAAAYGACCNDPEPERLASYSAKVYETVFAEENPPVALLTRDYALGIIELAKTHKVLNSNINIKLCYPPYNSLKPNFHLIEDEVKKLAEERGGKAIFNSASSDSGDFGKYTIPMHVEEFSREQLKDLKPKSEDANINQKLDYLKQCRLWVTKRAYELGWNVDLFPNDGADIDYSEPYHNLERIGKKYQHIALDELQARLADNFWVTDFSNEYIRYQHAHLLYSRNIEPSILPELDRFKLEDKDQDAEHWIIQPAIKLPDITEEGLKEWPFEQNPGEDMGSKLVRTDNNGKRWLVLYEHNSDRQSYEEKVPRYKSLGFRCMAFRFFYCIFIDKSITKQFLESIQNERRIDGFLFGPQEPFGKPYLLETFWRGTWSEKKTLEHLDGMSDEEGFLIPTISYFWEKHLDRTLPDGFGLYMPQKWFAKELGLNISLENLYAWKDKDGNDIIQTHPPTMNRTVVVIDETRLKEYANKFNIEPIWVMLAERNTYPGGLNSGISSTRRIEGIVSLGRNSWKETIIRKDDDKRDPHVQLKDF